MPMPGGPPAGPPGGTGAAASPGPMMGQAHQGVAGVRTALVALQKALPEIPMGSPLHTAILKAVTDISKQIGDGQEDKASTMQNLVGMARGLQTNPAQGLMQKLFPGGPGGAQQGAPPPPGGQPPEPPQ